MKLLILLFTLGVLTHGNQVDYEGYKVYHVMPSGVEDIKILKTLQLNSQLDFWSPLRSDGFPFDVMVSPEHQAWFADFLQTNLVKYSILINDVQETVFQERVRQLFAPRVQKGQVDFSKYLRHQEINAYLDQLASAHSDVITLENIGKSYEGRELNVAKISTDPNANKPAIFIDAGIHAREWIAPPVALYAIQQLVENKTNLNLLDKVDWHILPVVNPDGYEYTHEKERFWRKTRQPGAECFGTDGNRNFDYHWAEVGSSNNECSDIYHGKQAFSEPETAAIRDHVLNNQDSIKLYVTAHSYGQLLVYPWSYTSEKPEDHEELQAVGELAARAIEKVAGTKYKVAGSTVVLGATAGSSDDWVKGGAGVQLSYTLELPGGGSWGFNPPPSRILPVVVETWEGLKALHDYVAKKFN